MYAPLDIPPLWGQPAPSIIRATMQLGAAYAVCFSMALAHQLTQAGFTVEHVHTIAKVHFEQIWLRLIADLKPSVMIRTNQQVWIFYQHDCFSHGQILELKPG